MTKVSCFFFFGSELKAKTMKTHILIIVIVHKDKPGEMMTILFLKNVIFKRTSKAFFLHVTHTSKA